jgi:L,D-peptidoglycan transpeptidase YkuD (ErfK/YbiS/YcfS/YnhG family)
MKKHTWRVCRICLKWTCLEYYNARKTCLYCGGETIPEYNKPREITFKEVQR